MIKVRATVGNSDVVFLCLDRNNVERLFEGQPILFDGMQVGLPGVKISILAAETLADIREDLRSMGVPIP